MGACFMAATGAIMMLICPIVFRVLTPDPSVRTLAAQVLRIELLAEPLFGASIVELCVRGCLMLYRQRTSKYYDLYKKKTATENV